MVQNPGKFIVIEGLEGAGKSSAIAAIEGSLQAENIQYESVREPGGTMIAEQIRTILKTKQTEGLHNKAELLLMYASRIQLIQEVIKPALARGHWVIADRFEWSTVAYQGWGRGLDKAVIHYLSEFAVGELSVDKIIYLDIDPELGLHRVLGRGAKDRIELEALSFFKRVQRGYQWLIKHSDICEVIDARLPLEQVHNTLRAVVKPLLK